MPNDRPRASVMTEVPCTCSTLSALIMTALKISRLAQNTGHTDSWLDGIGYLALGGDIAAETAAGSQ